MKPKITSRNPLLTASVWGVPPKFTMTVCESQITIHGTKQAVSPIPNLQGDRRSRMQHREIWKIKYDSPSLRPNYLFACPHICPDSRDSTNSKRGHVNLRIIFTLTCHTHIHARTHTNQKSLIESKQQSILDGTQDSMPIMLNDEFSVRVCVWMVVSERL